MLTVSNEIYRHLLDVPDSYELNYDCHRNIRRFTFNHKHLPEMVIVFTDSWETTFDNEENISRAQFYASQENVVDEQRLDLLVNADTLEEIIPAAVHILRELETSHHVYYSPETFSALAKYRTNNVWHFPTLNWDSLLSDFGLYSEPVHNHEHL